MKLYNDLDALSLLILLLFSYAYRARLLCAAAVSSRQRKESLSSRERSSSDWLLVVLWALTLFGCATFWQLDDTPARQSYHCWQRIVIHGWHWWYALTWQLDDTMTISPWLFYSERTGVTDRHPDEGLSNNTSAVVLYWIVCYPSLLIRKTSTSCSLP